MRSATSSRWSSQDLPSGNSGATCWQNRLATCWPGGRERVVERRGDQHFDDRLAAPAVRARIQPGAVHVAEARRDDDAGGEMIAVARQRGERGQGAQRDIHPERAGAVAPVRDAREEFRRQRIRRHQARVQQFWIDVGGDVLGADGRRRCRG